MSLVRLRQLAAASMVSAFLAGTVGAVISLPVVPFQGYFQDIAGARWIDRAAQAQAESGFNPRAVSMVKGKDGKMHPCAYGLTQFTLPTWAEWAPSGADPFDPLSSIKAQHAYMVYLEARTQSFNAALGSYNAGPGSIRKAQRLADSLGLAGSDSWLRALPRVTGAAHSAETRGYIANNTRFRAAIRAKVQP